MLSFTLALLGSATVTIGPVQISGLPAWLILVAATGAAIRSRRIKAAARRLRRSPLRDEP